MLAVMQFALPTKVLLSVSQVTIVSPFARGNGKYA